jgi:hypothetical protein
VSRSDACADVVEPEGGEGLGPVNAHDRERHTPFGGVGLGLGERAPHVRFNGAPRLSVRARGWLVAHLRARLGRG